MQDSSGHLHRVADIFHLQLFSSLWMHLNVFLLQLLTIWGIFGAFYICVCAHTSFTDYKLLNTIVSLVLLPFWSRAVCWVTFLLQMSCTIKRINSGSLFPLRRPCSPREKETMAYFISIKCHTINTANGHLLRFLREDVYLLKDHPLSSSLQLVECTL